MLNTKYAFHICVSSTRTPAPASPLARYWGDIKICYNFISIQLIHKNHMFNITAPAFVSVSFVFPSPSSALIRFASTKHENPYLLFIFNEDEELPRRHEDVESLHMLLLLIRLNCFPSSPPRYDCFLATSESLSYEQVMNVFDNPALCQELLEPVK